MLLNPIAVSNIYFTNNFTKQIKDKTQNTLTNIIIMTSKNKQTNPMLTADSFFIMNRTTELLMETPLYQKTVSENSELKEKIRYLQYTIMYLEMKNKSLARKLKLVKKPQSKDDEVVFVEIKKEPVEVIHVDDQESVLTNGLASVNVVQEPIKYEIIETVKPEDIKGVEEEKDEEDEVDQEEEDVVRQEEDEVVEEEDAGEEEDTVDQEVEDVEEKAGDEEEEEEEEEEVVEEEEVEEEKEVVEEEEAGHEEEEEDQEEEEEAGVYEIIIKGKTYYISNETDSFIYKEDENGEISMEVGKYVDGKPTFYKK